MLRMRARRAAATVLAGAVAVGGLALTQVASQAAIPVSGSTIVVWDDSGELLTLTAPDGDPFVDVVASTGTSVLGLTESGKVVAGGNGGFGEHSLPSGLGNKTIESISTGSGAVAAVDTTGNVTFWGNEVAKGVSSFPGLSGVTEVEVNNYFGMAVLGDGSVRVWGDPPAGVVRDVEDVPAEVENVAEVSLGGQHAVAISETGQAFAWGRSTAAGSTVPASLDPSTGVRAVDSYNNFTQYIDGAGTIHRAGGRALPAEYSDESFVDLSITLSGVIALNDQGVIRAGNAPEPPSSVTSGVAVAVDSDQAGSYAAVVNTEEQPEPEFEVTTKPSITGDPVVGQVLTGVKGSYTLEPQASSTLWLVDGVPVPGTANRAEFEVLADHVGKSIQFREIAIRDNGSSMLTTDSDPVTAEAPPEFEVTTKPSITGDPVVGQVLTGVKGSYTLEPQASSTLWLVDGVPVPGTANRAEFEVLADHVGKSIQFREIAIRDNGSSMLTTDSDPVTAETPPFEVTTKPSITGDPVVGQVLTGVKGSYTLEPQASTTLWLADGTPIPGTANRAQLTVDAAHVGRSIQFREIAIRDNGSSMLTTDSDPLQAVAALAVAEGGDATVAGEPVVGTELTATPATFNDTSEDVSVTGQWMRGETAIEGATGTTYTLTRDDLGADITYVSTATRFESEDPVSSTSNAVGPVTLAPLEITGAPVINGNPFIGQDLTVTPATDNDDEVEPTFQWKADGTAIEGATDDTYTVQAADEGKAITVEQIVARNGATGPGPDYASAESEPTAPVREAPADLEIVEDASISGARIVGQTLTGTPAVFSDTEEATVTNFWVINGESVPAESNELVLTDDHVGAMIQFRSIADRQVDGASVTSTSESSVGPVLAQMAVEEAATIAGEAKVGETLTATPATFSGGEGTVTDTWLIDGEPIAHEGLTFELTEEHEGKVIGFRSIGERSVDGIDESVESAAETAAVAPADPVDPGPGPGEPGGPGGPGNPEPPNAEDLEGKIEILGSNTVAPGDTITVMVGEQYAGQQVTVMMFSTPRNLGTFTVAPNGTIQVQIPADAEPGTHRLAVYNAAGELIGWEDFTVVAPGGGSGVGRGPGGTLGRVGADTPEYLAPLGLAVLLAGAVTAGAGWRRRQQLS